MRKNNDPILRKLELRQAEVWVRILTARHYQHVRAASFSHLSASLESVTGDSGVISDLSDLNNSFSSDLESARSSSTARSPVWVSQHSVSPLV